MKKLLPGCVLVFGLMTSAVSATEAPVPFKLGVNYVPVMPAQPTSVNPGQIEVVEFFWYGNPKCFTLEPYLESWNRSKAANVVFKRVPAALNPQWDLAARAYYTAMQLGIQDKADAAIFDAIHVRHMNLATAADYQNLFTAQLGVDGKQFETTWNSLMVDTQIAQAKVLAQRYGVTDVPIIAVNGKWLTGSGYKLNNAQIMNTVNWLVQQEQSGVSAAAQ